MFGNNVAALLKDSNITLPQIICEPSLRHDFDDLAAGVLSVSKIAIVDDHHTAEAAGELVFSALKSRFTAIHLTLPKHPKASMDNVAWLRQQTSHCDALVAVGSGTINDLCKYTAALDNKPYIVFPTAASMNGYLSANASISESGYKNTFKARMPVGVFCDIGIIAFAPSRLNKSGFGDSLARPTAQADWLLSHLLLNTPYTPVPFALLSPFEPELLSHARGIAKGDMHSTLLLTKTLLLSGLGMTIAGGSYPASQGEHLIAHAYEMLEDTPTLHGEQIGITTLFMAQQQEQLLRNRPTVRKDNISLDNMYTLFGEYTANKAKKEFSEKFLAMQECMINDWDTIAGQIEPVTLPTSQIKAALEAAEAPSHITAIGWDETQYQQAIAHARYLRNRFTFLDLQR